MPNLKSGRGSFRHFYFLNILLFISTCIRKPRVLSGCRKKGVIKGILLLLYYRKRGKIAPITKKAGCYSLPSLWSIKVSCQLIIYMILYPAWKGKQLHLFPPLHLPFLLSVSGLCRIRENGTTG